MKELIFIVRRWNPFARLTKKECLYLLLCGIVCFFWSCVFFYDRYGPDEFARYSVPFYIYSHQRLPVGLEPETFMTVWGFSYAMNISIVYILQAVFMTIMSFFSKLPFMLVIAARFVSVLSYLGMGYYTVLISGYFFKGRIRWLFIFIMTLTPQVLFLGTYCNLDSFALFISMMIIHCWINGMDSGWEQKDCARLGFALGLCFLSYSFAYGFLIASFILYCSSYIMKRREVSFRRFITGGMIVLIMVFLVAGWYFVRNAILYHGDFLSVHTRAYYAEKFADPDFKPSRHQTPKLLGNSIWQMLIQMRWIYITLRSLVSVMGAMDIFVSRWVYVIYQFITGTGCIAGSDIQRQAG